MAGASNQNSTITINSQMDGEDFEQGADVRSVHALSSSAEGGSPSASQHDAQHPSTPEAKFRRTQCWSPWQQQTEEIPVQRELGSTHDEEIPSLPDHEFAKSLRLEDVISGSESRALEAVDAISARIANGQEVGEGPLFTLAAIQKQLWHHAQLEASLTQSLAIARDHCPSQYTCHSASRSGSIEGSGPVAK
jgi:hypothetical protein